VARVGQGPKVLFTLPQLLESAGVFLAGSCFLESLRNSKRQAADMTLENVIGRPRFHARYRGGFVHGSGEDDEREERIGCQAEFQRLHPIKSGYGIVLSIIKQKRPVLLA